MEKGRFIKKSVKKLFWVAGFAVFGFTQASFTLAQITNPLRSQTFAQLIENIARIVARIGTPIAVIAIIWAGFLFVTARGNEKKLEDAKRTFFWAILGTVILLGAWALAEALRDLASGL